MVSAPSLRKKWRREAATARRAERIANGQGRLLPMEKLLLRGLTLAVLLAIAFAVHLWLVDPLARGRAAMAAGDYRAARIDLINALEADPAALPVRVDLARTLNKLGRGREAERQLQRAIDGRMSITTLRTELAEAQLLQDRSADALATLAGAVPAAERPRAARIAAEAYYRMGNGGAAVRAFARAIDPSDAPVENWIAFARYRLAEQDVLGADAAADEARRRAPRSARALAMKAEVVRYRGGPVVALPWFEAALDIDPTDVPILLEYAAALGDAGRYRAMLDPLNRAAELDAANPRGLFLRATLAARGGEQAIARRLLNRISGRDANQPAVLQLRAAVELALETPSAAKNFAEQLLAMQPQNQTARQLLALAQAQEGEADEAIDTLGPITGQSDADSWSLLLLARSFAAVDWQEDVADPMGRATSLTRGGASVLPGAVDGGESLNPSSAVPTIRARIANGQAESALRLAQRLAEANAGVPQAQMLAGDAAMAKGDVAEALRWFRRTADLRYDENAMRRLVHALQMSGDAEGAEEALSQFMMRWPENVAAMRVAANDAAQRSDWQGALSILAAANARIGPNDVLLLAQMARARIEMGDASGAVRDAGHAYQLMPENATISGIYGIAIARSGGNAQDARDLLRKAVELAPEDTLLRQWRMELDDRPAT